MEYDGQFAGKIGRFRIWLSEDRKEGYNPVHPKWLREMIQDETSFMASSTQNVENVTSDLKCHSKSAPSGFSHSLTMYGIGALVLAGLALVLLSIEGCSRAGMGYRAAYKAARSELSPTTLARDERLKLQLREAILIDQTYEGFAITPYVFMERGFVVGLVENAEEADTIMQAARTVDGLRSLYGHLPVKTESSEDEDPVSGSLSDVTISTEVKGSLAVVPDVLPSQIDIKVLSGEVVLLGVVASDKVREAAEREARLVSGVHGVTNLLLLPESGYMKRRPRLLR